MKIGFKRLNQVILPLTLANLTEGAFVPTVQPSIL